MRTAEWSDTVSVLDRITAVLDALAAQDRGLGISELALRAQLPKSTVSRLVADLARQGCVERAGARVFLGLRLFEMGQSVPAPRRMRALALPLMVALRDTTGAGVELGLAHGGDVLVIAALPGRGVPVTPVGRRLSMADSALGRALTAAYTGDASVTGDGEQRLAAATAAGDVALSLVLPAGAEDDPGQTRPALARELRVAALTLSRRLAP